MIYLFIPVNFLVCINFMPKKDNTKSSSIATHNGLQTFGIANDVNLTNMLVLALQILLYSWLLFRSSYLNKEKSLANDKLTCATPTYYHVIIFMFLSKHNCILFHVIPYMCCELSAKISPSYSSSVNADCVTC